jgi:hypothetical protein
MFVLKSSPKNSIQITVEIIFYIQLILYFIFIFILLLLLKIKRIKNICWKNRILWRFRTNFLEWKNKHSYISINIYVVEKQNPVAIWNEIFWTEKNIHSYILVHFMLLKNRILWRFRQSNYNLKSIYIKV